MVKEVKLRNGFEVELEEKDPINLYEAIISEILIPKYKDNKDWNLTINIILEEINELISKYELDPKLKLGLLNQVEKHLDKEIEELTGTDKIEILFLNMDDYIEEIDDIMKIPAENHEDKMKRLHTLGDLLASLNTFEISELLNYYIEKACKDE